VEEQIEVSKPTEKVIPHQELKTEEDRFKQGKPVKEDEYNPGQPIRLGEARRKCKKKKAKLWDIKKLKTDGTIELEDPYSRRTKVVTKVKRRIKTSVINNIHIRRRKIGKT